MVYYILYYCIINYMYITFDPCHTFSYHLFGVETIGMAVMSGS